ncbi:MAG: YkgJ family cysteine cluster protein [Planctomycetaceae bacterium]
MSDTADPETPWYHAGLKFRCTQCGHCCTGTPGFVWVDDEEIAAIAEYLDKPLGEIRLMHVRPHARGISLTEFANGDCTFLDPKTRRCRIYPVRPRQCRTWPFWNSNLEDEDAWAEAGETCPGIGRGDFVPLQDIEAQAGVIDI